MSSLSSRNFLIATLPFLEKIDSDDASQTATTTAPDVALLCITSSSFMNGSFVPEFIAKAKLTLKSAPVFRLANTFSSTLQFTTKLNLCRTVQSSLHVALIKNQMQTKRYFTRQLTCLECIPFSRKDQRIFLKDCLPHLRALRKLSIRMRDLESKKSKSQNSSFLRQLETPRPRKKNNKRHAAALAPLANLEELSIDGSTACGMWLSEIWKLNPMEHLRKLTIIGCEHHCYLRDISDFHSQNLEVLDITFTCPIYQEVFLKLFGITWSVPDLRKMNNLRELYLRGESILKEAVVDRLLGYQNYDTDDVEEHLEDDHPRDEFGEILSDFDFDTYEDSDGKDWYVRKYSDNRYYGEAHRPWGRVSNRVKIPLNDSRALDQQKNNDDGNNNNDDDGDNDAAAVSSSSSSSSSLLSSFSARPGILKKLHKLHFSGGPHQNSYAGEVRRIINEIGSTWITELDLNDLKLECETRIWDQESENLVVGPEGHIHLDDRVMTVAVEKFPNLLELDLRSLSHLGDATLSAIGEHCTSLKKLRLPNLGHTTDHGIAALFDPEQSTNTFRTLEELTVGTKYWDGYPDCEREEERLEFEGRVFGVNWFGPSGILAEKMSYCLRKLDCSDLVRLNPESLVQIMDAFSHCLEEFNLPIFDIKAGHEYGPQTLEFDLFEQVMKFPTMQKLKTVTNLPLMILGLPNVRAFLRACPALQKLAVVYDDDKFVFFDHQWERFEKQQPGLKELRRMDPTVAFDSDDGEDMRDCILAENGGELFDEYYFGPSFDDLLIEVAKILGEIDEKNTNNSCKYMEFGFTDEQPELRRVPEIDTWNAFAEIKSLARINISKEYLPQFWSFADKRKDVLLCDAKGNAHKEIPAPSEEEKQEDLQKRRNRIDERIKEYRDLISWRRRGYGAENKTCPDCEENTD